MPSESICAAAAAAAFLLAAGASHAQNKCIDERGKITYQTDPCPGASAKIRTPAEIYAPRPAVTPAPALPGPAAALPPGAGPVGPSPQALRIELNELEQCASDWKTYSGSMQRKKANDDPRFASMERDRMQELMARFLPVCGKYGFESPRDAAALKRNDKAAQSLAGKIAAKRAEMEAAAGRELATRASRP